jgi:hypothetical protein
MPTLHQVCQRTIVLSRGVTVFDGPTDQAISVYHELMHNEGADRNEAGVVEESGAGRLPFLGGARVTCGLIDDDGVPTRQATSGEPLRVRVHAEFDEPTVDPVVGLAVSLVGIGAVHMSYLRPGDYRGAHGPGSPLDLTITLDNRLLPASYGVTTVVLDADGRHELARSVDEIFAVTSTTDARGILDMDPRFDIGGQEFRPRRVSLTERA